MNLHDRSFLVFTMSGIAGGCGEGLLIKKGEIVKKVKEEELLETLRQELLHWNE